MSQEKKECVCLATRGI